MKPAILLAMSSVLFAVDHDAALRLINQGKAEEAAATLRGEIESSPKDARAHELLAQAYLKLNKLDEANQEASTAAGLEPESASVHVTVARIAIARQNWNLASQELNKAAALDASNPEIQLHKGSLALARKDYKGAVDLLTPYVNENPDEAYGHYYLGLAQYGMRRPDKTVEQFQRFLKLAPDAPEAARVESLLRSIR